MADKENQRQILSYDYETQKIKIEQKTSTSQKASEMVTKIKEIKWDFEEKSGGFFIPKLMKICDKIYGDKSSRNMQKSKKENKKNEMAEQIRYLYSKIPKPRENKFKCNIKINEKTNSIKIDYYCLCSIGNLIMSILENIINQTNYQQLLFDIINQNNFSSIFDTKIWEGTLFQYKNALNKIETINFSLSSSHDSSIELENVFLFSFFYRVLFQNVKHVTINLDETKINNIYNTDKNPYKIENNYVCAFGQKFEKLFIANFIITDLISNYEKLSALRIVMSESYINEMNYIFGEQFDKYAENIKKKNCLIYFRKLMFVETISTLRVTFNCLDTFLFKEIVHLIAQHRDLEYLELELFNDQKTYNFRKLYLNYLALHGSDIDPNLNEKYQVIIFPYVDDISQIPEIIDEEKIPDLLFKDFRKNLKDLKILLNDFVKTFKGIYLDTTPYEELIKYDNYNIEIILFVFTIIAALEKSKMLIALELKCLNIKYESVLQIKNKICKLLEDNGNLIDLSECKVLESLTFNMEGISELIDFNKLPYHSLKKLFIEINCISDLKNLVNSFKCQKDNIQQLKEVYININLFEEDTILNELIEMFKYIPSSLEILRIIVDNEINLEYLMRVLKLIQKNQKNNQYVTYFNCHSTEIEELAKNENEKFDGLQKIFENNDIFFVGKYDKISTNSNKIKMTLLKYPENNITIPVVYCLDKKIKEVSNEILQKDKSKIYSKIFGYFKKPQDIYVTLE